MVIRLYNSGVRGFLNVLILIQSALNGAMMHISLTCIHSRLHLRF